MNVNRTYKRKHVRHFFDESITISILDSSSGKYVHREIEGRVRDISWGGIGIVTDSRLDTGRLVCFGPDKPELGAVVWSRKGRSNGYFRIGIQFLRPEERHDNA